MRGRCAVAVGTGGDFHRAAVGRANAGDHMLVTDSAYGPTRNFCEQILSRLGVATTYYDPLIGAGIAELFRPNTRAVYLESPGSLSFEMQDVAAIAAGQRMTRARSCSWTTPGRRRFISVRSITASTSRSRPAPNISAAIPTSCSAPCRPMRHAAAALKNTVRLTGLCEGPDDVYLGLRGLRTLAVRLERHYKSGIAVARWLEQRPEVLRLLHPAMPSHPGHRIWKRDFTGACGLFSVVLKPVPQKAVYAFLDTLTLFGIGASWGGYESLAIPFDCTRAAHRDALGAGRPDRALPHRPRSGRRPYRRSRTRLCGTGRGGRRLSERPITD